LADSPLLKLRARLEAELKVAVPDDAADSELDRRFWNRLLLNAVQFALRGDWAPLERHIADSTKAGRPLDPEVAAFVVAVMQKKIARPDCRPAGTEKRWQRDAEIALRILRLTKTGEGLTEAKHRVAERLGVSFSTAERAWKEHNLLAKRVYAVCFSK
jgi:hypothetical protein